MQLFVIVLLIVFANFTSESDADQTKLANRRRFSALLQSRSYNENNHCPLVCKNPGNYNSDGSSTIIYISQSETVIGFYDTSTKYAFLLDWTSQLFLIIDVNRHSSAIFSWSTGRGYYITRSVNVEFIYSASGSTSSVIQYFQSITTSLKVVFNAYVQHGQSFSISELRESQVRIIIEGFVRAVFSSQVESYGSSRRWAYFAYSAYQYFRYSLRRAGIYVIYESGRILIEDLFHHQGGRDSSGQQNFTQTIQQILTQLGTNNQYFNDNIQQLLQSAGIGQSSPQLIGFLRFFELLSSINVTAAYNAISNGNTNISLTQFLLPNSQINAHQFEEILRNNPELERFLIIFIQASRGQNWTLLFNSSIWRQLFSNVPGFQQFIQFVRSNPGFSGFLKLGETFADTIKDFAKNIADMANSFPIPNPFAPFISAFAGGIGGAASQASNGLHLFDGIFGDGEESSGQANNGSNII